MYNALRWAKPRPFAPLGLGLILAAEPLGYFLRLFCQAISREHPIYLHPIHLHKAVSRTRTRRALQYKSLHVFFCPAFLLRLAHPCSGCF
jgi:hypothetical protein